MSRWIPRLRAGWDRFWFAPATPENLGFCRLLFFAGVLVFTRRDYSALAGVSAVFWKPIWWFRLLGFPQPSRELLETLQVIWRLALAASCVGVWTRAATAVSFFAGTYLLGLQYCFGGSNHAKIIVVWAMASLAMSRCGDAWSVDRWAKARRGWPEPAASGEYRWPIRLVWVAMACAFFAAGISKLRHAGLAWVTSDTLAIFLVRSNYPLIRDANPPMFDWGLRLARHEWLCRALAAGSLAIETLFPLALFSRRLRPILVAGALLMQLGITAVMGPNFDVFIWSYIFWVPWDRIAGWVRGSKSGWPPEPVVARGRRLAVGRDSASIAGD